MLSLKSLHLFSVGGGELVGLDTHVEVREHLGESVLSLYMWSQGLNSKPWA